MRRTTVVLWTLPLLAVMGLSACDATIDDASQSPTVQADDATGSTPIGRTLGVPGLGTLVEQPDGSFATTDGATACLRNADGSFTAIDGDACVQNPDGVFTATDGKGNTVTQGSDGSCTATGADGSSVVVNPVGSVTVDGYTCTP